ncbi:MAG: Asp-tRNA(Asn)/Glu-tRNA(Gln) amidotransferase subunit GatC [Chloroflexi bacterium]|nr:Asp-tRNA(Asn)/Glu-tRNA(Gln) amidotransferase subunit GatC [Chloroflexota bacterium]
MAETHSQLTIEEVYHIAALARVAVTPEEAETLRAQLNHILESFRILQELDTTGVEPTGHAIALQNVMREDVSRDSFSREAVLANAPNAQEGFFRVKAILEE